MTNHWAYTDIKRVYNRGWMVGESATIFAPDQDLTRAMLAVILYAMAGMPASVTSAHVSPVSRRATIFSPLAYLLCS